MKKIIIATKNKGKAMEFKELFMSYQISAISLLDISVDLPDVEETGETFTDNARLKAEKIASILNLPVLADDSGLMIDALDGQPGIYSARYAGENKNDQANMEKVIKELSDIPFDERTARFICVLAIAGPGKDTIFRTGYCEGLIPFSAKGTNGFGYDPIFVPKGYEKTMAQMDPKEKAEISHRNHALKQLEKWMQGISK